MTQLIDNDVLRTIFDLLSFETQRLPISKRWRSWYQQNPLYRRKLTLELAGKMGNRNLIMRLKSKGHDDWSNGLKGAAIRGDFDLMTYFILESRKTLISRMSSITGSSQWTPDQRRELARMVRRTSGPSTINWNDGLEGAAEGGHRGLIGLSTDRGARNWNRGMIGAARGGHIDMVKEFLVLGANALEKGLIAGAEGGHEHMVEFFILRGARNLNEAITTAARNGHKHLEAVLLKHGGTILACFETRPVRIEAFMIKLPAI